MQYIKKKQINFILKKRGKKILLIVKASFLTLLHPDCPAGEAFVSPRQNKGEGVNWPHPRTQHQISTKIPLALTFSSSFPVKVSSRLKTIDELDFKKSR